MRATNGKSFNFQLNCRLLLIATLCRGMMASGAAGDAIVSPIKPRYCGKALTNMLEFVCVNGFHARRVPRCANTVPTLLPTINERQNMQQSTSAATTTQRVALTAKATTTIPAIATTALSQTNNRALINAKLKSDKNQNNHEHQIRVSTNTFKRQQRQLMRLQRRRRWFGIVYECCKIGCYYTELLKYCL